MRAVERNKGLGVALLCSALAVSRATYYRRNKPPAEPARRRQPRALSDAERAEVLIRFWPSEIHSYARGESVGKRAASIVRSKAG
jgi:hypothetical protein